MADLTYDMIAPNVASATTTGSQVEITWKCPATGKDMGKTTAHQSYDSSLGGKVSANVKQGIIREIGYGIMNFIGGLLGGGAGSRIARDATYTASSSVQQKAYSSTQYTEATKRAAIVESFKTIQEKFDWNAEKKQFIAK